MNIKFQLFIIALSLEVLLQNALAGEMHLKRIKLVPSKDDGIYAMAFTPDGKQFAAAAGSEDSGGSGLYLAGLDNANKFEFIGQSDSAVTLMLFLSDSKRIAVAECHGDCRLWDCTTRKRIGVLKGHSKSISGMAMNSDGTTLATGCVGGQVRFWNLATLQQIAMIELGDEEVNDLAFHPSKNLLAIATSAKKLRMWDVGKNKELFHVDGEPVLSVKFCSKGHSIVTHDSAGWILVQKIDWESKTTKSTFKLLLKGKDDYTDNFDLTPDDTQLVIGYRSDIQIISLVSDAVIKQISLASHSCSITSVAFSPNGFLCSGSVFEPHIWMSSSWPKPK